MIAVYSYMICNQPDEALFYQQCAALEKNVPGLKKGKLLHDVDDSLTQLYSKDGIEITVHNSHYEKELYVESGIDLKPFFAD